MAPHPLGDFIQYLLYQEANEWNQWVGYMVEYKGFVGKYAFNEETGLFQGKVADREDLIIFEGKSIEATHKAFREAVDAYLEWGERYGKKE